jgi:hypothetical protein
MRDWLRQPVAIRQTGIGFSTAGCSMFPPFLALEKGAHGFHGFEQSLPVRGEEHERGAPARGIFPGGNETVFEQPVDQHLNVLPRNGAGSGELRYGLRAQTALQNAAATRGALALAVDFCGDSAEAVKQGRSLVK